MTPVPPRMDLPESAMPWGRWVQEELSAARSDVEHAGSDADSAGSQFRAKTDNVSQLISQFATKRLTMLNLPDISGYASGAGPAWINYGVNVGFNASSRVKPEGLMVVSMTIPAPAPGVISNGPNHARILVNGLSTFGLFNLNRLFAPVGSPVTSSRVPIRMPITLIPGGPNIIRVELGSYNTTGTSISFPVEATDFQIALMLEGA